MSALLGPSTEIAKLPPPASRVHTLNSHGIPHSPRSNPAPPALTKCDPASLSGPTVNWKGEPIKIRNIKKKTLTIFLNLLPY